MEDTEATRIQSKLSRLIWKGTLAQIQPLLETGCIEAKRLHPFIARGIVSAAHAGRSDLMPLFLEYAIERHDLNDALLQASFFWRRNIVKALLEAGADVDARDENGRTPLISLVYGIREDPDADKELATARFLVEHGVDLNAVDDRGGSALNYLLDHIEGSQPLAQFLLKSGAKVGPVEAALLGDTETLAAMLAQAGGLEALQAQSPNWTWAWAYGSIASRGYLDVMRLLLSHAGADASRRAHYCLGDAMRAGQIDMVRLLLQYGATLKPYQAENVMQGAVQRGNTPLVRFMLDEYGLDIHMRGLGSSFRYACYHNTHPDTIALLLERADKECLVKWKLSEALGGAAEFGNVAIVKLLLAYGAEVNRFHDFHTPLMFAARSGHVEVVGILLEAGANKHAKRSSGGQLFTVLGCAQAGGNAEILQMLL